MTDGLGLRLVTQRADGAVVPEAPKRISGDRAVRERRARMRLAKGVGSLDIAAALANKDELSGLSRR